jgi:hypothetical protein
VRMSPLGYRVVSSVALSFQDHGSGLQPCAHESRKLKAAEVNYTICETETCELVYTLFKWRHYLEGAVHFTVKTEGICTSR